MKNGGGSMQLLLFPLIRARWISDPRIPFNQINEGVARLEQKQIIHQIPLFNLIY